ncbi:hypothetical protein SEA_PENGUINLOVER67_69 [Mycobacterium phage PenguinLover67]|nr:hypothetical protein SEA_PENGUINLOVER67_69 [Mycobacterium phage PenguinLover67]
MGAHPDNVAEARKVAEAWAEREGMEIGAGSFSVIASTNGLPIASQGGWLGVSFEVTVGKGDIDPADPEADSWTWSARMHHWRRFLSGTGRIGRKIAAREDGTASVTRIHARDGGSGRAGIAAGLEPGCVCHIGGPFPDICPVHFEADR